MKISSKRLLLVAGAVSTVGLASLAGISGVSAQSDNTNKNGIVESISSKFNLNSDEVKKVFEEHREKREAEHDKKRSERLQKLLDNGTITANQKTVIETKLADLKSDREANKDSFKDLTPEQRKSKMDEKKAELEAWAKENGIDLTKLKGAFRGGHEGRHGHRHQIDQKEQS